MGCEGPASCQCPFTRVWQHANKKIFVYPQSELCYMQGLLLRYPVHPTKFALWGAHTLDDAVSFNLEALPTTNELNWSIRGRERRWGLWLAVCGVGLRRVRVLQRWFRRLLLLKSERALAVMLLPTRGGLWGALDDDVLRLIVSLL